jgi:hypothetical protein
VGSLSEKTCITAQLPASGGKVLRFSISECWDGSDGNGGR